MLALLIHLLRTVMLSVSTVSVAVPVTISMPLSGSDSRRAGDELRLREISSLLRAEVLNGNKISTSKSANHLNRRAGERKSLYACGESLWKK